MELRTLLEVFAVGAERPRAVLTSFGSFSCINIFLKLGDSRSKLRAQKNNLIEFGEGDNCLERRICAEEFLIS